MEKVYVVTPVYEDEPSFKLLVKNLKTVLGQRLYLIAIDDGSLSSRLARYMGVYGAPGEVVRLRRNFGHQIALAVGLRVAASKIGSKEVVVVMDSDGEDDPQAIPLLLDGLAMDRVEICVALRGKRSEGAGFRIGYIIYRFLFRLLCGSSLGFGNFMALSSAALRKLDMMEGIFTHFAASILLSNMKISGRRISRAPRYSGHTKMNLSSLVLHGLRAMTVFSDRILVRVCLISAVIIVAGGAGISAAIIAKTMGYALPGWTSMVVLALGLIMFQAATATLIAIILSDRQSRHFCQGGISVDKYIEK